MSEIPPRPPAPGQSAAGPGSKQSATGPGPQKPEKKKGFAKQMKPTIIMAVLIAAVALGYMAVRAGRDALSPPDPKALTLPADMGYISLELPQGWRSAKMGDVAGASGRWAFGPQGAREYAMFVTRYRLKRKPDGDEGQKAVLKEAEASLKVTGGPRKPKPVGDEKIGGQPSFRYAFRKQDMWIDIWLTIHNFEDKAALYQFSCQSKPGGSGKTMRERCAEILNSVRFSDKAP